MVVGYVIQSLTALGQVFHVVVQLFVEHSQLLYKPVTLVFVSLFQLRHLVHNFVSVHLQVFKYCCLNCMLLVDCPHTLKNLRLHVLHLVSQDFSLSCTVCNLEVNLLENIEFTACVENCLLELIDAAIDFFLLLKELVDGVFVLDEIVLNWLHEVIDNFPSPPLDVVPQQLEGRVLHGKTKFISSLQLLLSPLSLPLKRFGQLATLGSIDLEL